MGAVSAPCQKVWQIGKITSALYLARSVSIAPRIFCNSIRFTSSSSFDADSRASRAVVFPIVCLRRVCLRNGYAKLIQIFVTSNIIVNFVMHPDEGTGSAEEQRASNKAVPKLIAERHRESSIWAAPFAIRKAHRLRKPNCVSPETISCHMLCLATVGQMPCDP